MSEFLERTKGLEEKLAEIQGPVIAQINVLLADLHGRSFESWGEAVETVDAVRNLVRRAGCRLFYEKEPIAIQCVDSRGLKHPKIQAICRVEGQRKALYSATKFPPLHVDTVL